MFKQFDDLNSSDFILAANNLLDKDKSEVSSLSDDQIFGAKEILRNIFHM